MLSFLLIQRYNDAFFMPVNFIIQSENVKARQEESTMKIRKYACIAISAALLMTGCQATPDQDIVANKNDNQASQNEGTKTDWEFHPASYWMKDETNGDDEDWSKEDKTESLEVRGDYEGKGAHISASNRQDADYQVHDMFFVLNDEVDINYNADPVISREEAIQMTSEKLKALTDKEWQVDSVDNNGNQWRIKYVPVINNLPCLLTDLVPLLLYYLLNHHQ